MILWFYDNSEYSFTLRTGLRKGQIDKFGLSGAGTHGSIWYWVEFSLRGRLDPVINHSCLFRESLNWSSVCTMMFVVEETKHLQSSSYVLKVMLTLSTTELRHFKNFWPFSLLLEYNILAGEVFLLMLSITDWLLCIKCHPIVIKTIACCLDWPVKISMYMKLTFKVW